MKKFQFKINGKFYDVELVNVEGTTPITQTTAPVQQAAPVAVPAATPAAEPVAETRVEAAPAAVNGKVSGHILAPLPGILRSFNVKPGDRIKNGDTVLVLEAMKMENNIFADRDGVVLELTGQIGEAVLEGDKLIALGD
jgi:glutaconyl-CoA/methylmalonyl-CoA decarboxylase subunit gamma